MKKDNCELVQDLLLGYFDQTINKSSKKLVEEHLETCEECKEKYEEIKKELENEKGDQNKQIKYLKKLKRRTRIKAVIFAMIIILIILLSYYMIKFLTLNSVLTQMNKTLEKDNLYVEYYTKDGNDIDLVIKTWIKGEKYKTEYVEYYADESYETTRKEYGNISSKGYISIDENEKIVKYVKVDYDIRKENLLGLGSLYSFNDLYFKLLAPISYDIITGGFYGGNNFIKLEDRSADIEGDKYSVIINRNTGFPTREINNITSTGFFRDTDLIKEETKGETIYNYNYEFVKEEDVTIPNLEGYKVEIIDWSKENITEE